MQTKQDLIQWLDDNQAPFIDMSDKIWEKPELGWQEFYASQLQADYLAGEGFTVWSIESMNTAFIAQWGEGEPIIGIAGEYDALPGLSQKRQSSQEALEEGAAGHGCGHNMLGTAGVAAAVALRHWLEATGTPGAVRYYGCPAEENGDAKGHMARAGTFDDLAVGFNFHPSVITIPAKGSSVGVYDARYRFHGRTAHAGGSPHLGRSALDAVELMNVGVNFLREHVLPSVRMHYTITKGGEAPNIVPDLAEVWYFLRAHLPEELEDIVKRVRKIAEGAALMTGTELEEIFCSAVASVLSNHYLADLQYDAMKVIGPIDFTDEEIAFAETINSNYPEVMIEDQIKYMTDTLHIPEEKVRKPLLAENFPASDQDDVSGGSTDVGDMSWCVPLSMVTATCWPMAAPGHSWGNVATGGMSIGHKGMMHAAKIMAVAAMDCYSDPVHIQKARAEFDKSTANKPYKSMIPDHLAGPPEQYPAPPGGLVDAYPQCPFYKLNGA